MLNELFQMVEPPSNTSVEFAWRQDEIEETMCVRLLLGMIGEALQLPGVFPRSGYYESQPMFRFVGRLVDHGTDKLAGEFPGGCVTRDKCRRTTDGEGQH